MTATETSRPAPRELRLTSLIDAPREKLFRAWTEPALVKQWFAPLPWTTPVVEIDARTGGSSHIVMRGPDGEEADMRGVYLEVVPNERLVFSDAYVSAWQPSEKPFMTGIITFEPAGAQTRYTARVLHWSEAACDQHEAMGFHQGWTQCAGQLAALAARM
jgi:uncharacterized protein YndB with AHSA1/START domain